jgi:hypothetical protein
MMERDMPDMYEEWLIEAEAYAEDVYQLTLKDLGHEFDDCSCIMESASYWVDQAVERRLAHEQIPRNND